MNIGPVFTPANQLTMMRLLLIPAFVILLMYGYRGWALVTFMVAGLTDLLDGLIARMSGEKTTLGAWLDPMAISGDGKAGARLGRSLTPATTRGMDKRKRTGNLHDSLVFCWTSPTRDCHIDRLLPRQVRHNY